MAKSMVMTPIFNNVKYKFVMWLFFDWSTYQHNSKRVLQKIITQQLNILNVCLPLEPQQSDGTIP